MAGSLEPANERERIDMKSWLTLTTATLALLASGVASATEPVAEVVATQDVVVASADQTPIPVPMASPLARTQYNESVGAPAATPTPT
jgi:hypothetical protein